MKATPKPVTKAIAFEAINAGIRKTAEKHKVGYHALRRAIVEHGYELPKNTYYLRKRNTHSAAADFKREPNTLSSTMREMKQLVVRDDIVYGAGPLKGCEKLCSFLNRNPTRDDPRPFSVVVSRTWLASKVVA